MRRLKYGLIILVVLVIVILVWFFRPFPPSGLKGNLYKDTYLAGIIKTRGIWNKPLSSIIASVPLEGRTLPNIPFYLKPFIPPTIELYVAKTGEEGEMAVAVDLGWRSRLFRIIRGTLMEQIQYRGVGVIEGEYTIRTPEGKRILIYQDEGTLFLAEGDNIINRIIRPVSDKGKVSGIKPGEELTQQVYDKKDIAYISFSNDNKEITRSIEDLEKKLGFLILSSSGSIKGGTIKLRKTGSNTLVIELVIGVTDISEIEAIEGDITYIIELLDRFLSNSNLKAEMTINTENDNIMTHVMIHPTGKSK
ncbi:MAG: hypothetical protein A2035_06400 [Nitrospirae bacterium GWA2_42_11]|nr:MAG: hypothetical protein A2035_06400 [Nitrospirae bacterium GWA2_42_11]HAS17466.1 hypothetical protein [Nitrospiraceae bacterium]